MENTDTSVVALLGAAHRVLMRDLQGLEEMTQGAAPDPAAMTARLDEVRQHLADHFRFEEHNGYMQAVLARAPHLARKVEQLGAEHGTVARDLAALLHEARSSAALDDAFLAKVRAWLDRVRDHEARENILVEDAFNREFGAEA
jgi:hypothetical protein